jgi:2-polyprenyl-3-methyl-5-hydroxy-6-metoxy-1,4-benzoquinol methylase
VLHLPDLVAYVEGLLAEFDAAVRTVIIQAPSRATSSPPSILKVSHSHSILGGAKAYLLGSTGVLRFAQDDAARVVRHGIDFSAIQRLPGPYMVDRWAERTWRPFGRIDPYYGVLSNEQFRADRLDAKTLDEFFQTGEDHVAWTIDSIRRLIDPEFKPTRVLDFGCGVGRLVLPFARQAAEVVGADISPEMLDEGRRNAANAGLTNTTFVRVDEHLDSVAGQFDLVHSFIVFQHIPPTRGEQIMMRLARKLVPGGVGALHFVYRREASTARKAVHALRKHVPGVNEVVNLVQRRALRDPFIPMYRYSLDRVIDQFRSIGCSELSLTFTNHGGHIGAVIFFKMPTTS